MSLESMVASVANRKGTGATTTLVSCVWDAKSSKMPVDEVSLFDSADEQDEVEF